MSNVSVSSLASVYAQLTDFANLSNFWSLFNTAFGSSYDSVKAASFRSQWQSGDFSLFPQIEVVSGDVLGTANGAYAISTNKIYLSDAFISSASQQSLEAVILEEFGHFVDAQVNATDTAGDEGELFSALVRGVSLSSAELSRIKTEDDHAVVVIGGKNVAIEQALSPDPGSTFNTAYNIGNLAGTRTFTESISTTDISDYYKFSLTGTNNITLQLSGVTQNYLYAKIYYDSNNNGLIDSGDELYSNIAGSGYNAQINTTLGAGNYYIGVSQYYSNVNSNYSLQLSATSAPASIASNPGNTLSTAYNIGNLTGTQTITEFVGSVDLFDYYKFSLTGTNDITLQLSGVTQNYLYAKIYYDSNNNGLIDSGDELYSNIAGSGYNAQINTTLGAGNYYIGVSQYYSNVNSNYSLQLSATSAPASIASNPGNTLSTAYNIGNLTGTQTITEFVGSVDLFDYYKFSLTGTNDITLQLSGVTQNYLYAKIYYDSNNNGLIDSGDELYSNIAGSGYNAQINTTLGAGNYYIGVSQYYSNVNSNYSLQLSATSAPASIASNPGNTLSTAYNIGNLTGTQTITEFVGSVDLFDYYKFSLTGTNDITLQLSGVTQNYLYAKIYYDSNNNGLIDSGDELYSNIAGSGYNAQINTTLGAGNYYIGVSQYYSNVNSNYSLQLSATSAPASIASNPGNTLSTAYNIGNLTGTQTITEFVGSVDLFDYYKFSLTGTNDITLQLSGVTQNYLYAKIYYDSNNNGLIDSGDELYSNIAGSGYNAQINTTLGAGNYYVGISQYYSNVNSNYSLTLVNITNPNPSITLAVAPTSVLEDGTNNLVYTFTRTGPITNALTVNYGITGTATNGTDYATIGTSVTFAANSAIATVTVNPTADTTIENNETVALTLATGIGYTIGTTTAVTGTITNDDVATLPSITLAITPTSVLEDGTPNLIYTFTRTGATTNALTVNYGITGTATNGTDYATIGTSVTFAANSATATVTVNPTADTTIENNETAVLTLATGTSYTIGTTTAVTGTITNDDGPTISLGLNYSAISEDSPSNFIYTFTRTGATTNSLTVNYSIAGTALSTDYTGATPGTSKTITFAAGSATATLTLDPTADTTLEPNETVILQLVSGTEYTIGTTATQTATIINDDNTRNQQGTNGNSVLLGKNYSDYLTGGTGNDILNGAGNSDYLTGAAGNDTLTGGSGGDTFFFANANLGIDTITDFTPNEDTIFVSAQGFGSGLIAGNPLTQTQFILGSSATSASQRFIYNSTNGALLFDADGNGLGTAKQIATLSVGLALTSEDIFVN
ncbi:MAG: hypothetical protein KA717_23210 [Woronichinia naegeliana WA131]|uniref:Calx-beta domain-containing protein n=1 Tax=Woronichinia naegeliana WA131 TaxID=2824559 RepID=A0A977KSG0_9CYAN|nr:MAG: hypothetical protein KA717_23210 [Woronichinia naegeliana WA131]